MRHHTHSARSALNLLAGLMAFLSAPPFILILAALLWAVGFATGK